MKAHGTSQLYIRQNALVSSESATSPGEDETWFSVRTVVRVRTEPVSTYEERVSLWLTASFEQAVTLAEQDAHDYAGGLPGADYVGLAQAYQLPDRPGHGVEVFSLMRDSDLEADAYLDTYFDTGSERQGSVEA